ncbi:MAG: hypothetical protein DME42_10065 [Verrucomicrobia bacterium]|nr:MAG: hypothetical protein DME42_10065 [Verrucomicrobiota bacterium]
MDEFENNEIGQLLRLKKYEQPPPGYFENFLHEFHRRQRDELLRQPLWRIALGRAQDFMMSLNVARIASYPVAVTAVLLCTAVISLKIYQTTPAPNVARLSSAVPAEHATEGGWSLAAPVSTRITVSQPRTHLSTHRAATPPRYVLDSMPVSYESSLRF